MAEMKKDYPQEHFLISNLHEEGIKDYFQKARFLLKSLNEQGASGKEVVEKNTLFMDRLIAALYRIVKGRSSEEKDGTWAIIAVGGYGRSELCPYSDVDLIFLSPTEETPFIRDLREIILYNLWNAGVDVGFSTKTIEDCIQGASEDLKTRTSFLDSRFLLGDAAYYQGFEKMLGKEVLYSGVKDFIQEKLLENEKRHEKYGGSLYILEPNVKEGEGGLRDIHTAMWIAKTKFRVKRLNDLKIKTVIADREQMVFEKSLEFLWRVRNELHFLSGYKNDILSFEFQERLAELLKFKSSEGSSAVERFMQSYYLHAKNICHLSNLLIDRCLGPRTSLKLVLRDVGNGFIILGDSISIKDSKLFHQNPLLLMEIFEYAQRHGVKIHSSTREDIISHLRGVDDKFRQSQEVNQSFLSILQGKGNVFETLRTMHELRFLGKYIPEFGKTFCKVQYDQYHIYTVDAHSLSCLAELKKLEAGLYLKEYPLLSCLIKEVEKPLILYLAALLHDIGKAEGSGHCHKGGKMIPAIAKRLGLRQEDSLKLEFLVRNHLMMAHLAQRRDLIEEKLIMNFAKAMGNESMLKMLYLLTFADLKAVGPGVWNEWKDALIQELYFKASEILQKGEFKRIRVHDKVAQVKKEARELLKDNPTQDVEKFLSSLPPRYFISNTPKSIFRHFLLSEERKHKLVVMEKGDDLKRRYSEITICAKDEMGLFSKIAGVLSANNLNILGAQINTRDNGEVLDILQVNTFTKEPLLDEKKWEFIKKDLEKILKGEKDVEELIRRKAHFPKFKERKKPKVSTNVEIDNSVSDSYTVIDVYTEDRVGLLYTITKTLTQLGLDIHISKISTKVDQVADVFYVTDAQGKKIRDETKLNNIRNTLMQALTS